AVFMLLQACIGLEMDAPGRTLRFNRARLPAFLDHLRIENLAVGDASLDLLLARQPQGMSVDVVGRRGDVEIVTVK
ncbi:MAG: amylo-alpha-1,6-glucosidase, partial [Candidatus Limnocylindria bacterium]